MGVYTPEYGPTYGETETVGIAGQPVTLTVDFWIGGVLADPSSVQLDITYGSELGFAPDVAGPFTYQGASAPTAGQVWRVSTGVYSCTWQIPASVPEGSYVANWSIGYGDGSYPGSENFWVSGGYAPPVPAGDLGYWTGGLIYPAAGLDIEFGTVDSNGIAWLWQKITGWDGPPVQGAGVIPRSGDHGAWASPQYYAARTLTLTVTASAPTQALRDAARALLQQAVPVSDLATLRYDEPVSKVARVRRSGQLTEAYPTLCDVTFTIGLVAPDMRKYATAGKTLTITPVPSGGGGGMTVPFTVPFTLDSSAPPGSAVAVNLGNFGSPPVAVITGPVTGPALANLTTGETVSWSTLTLPSGSIAVVDFLNRETWVNPSAVSTVPGMPSGTGTYWPADISSAWWDLEPGSNAIELGGSTGSGCSATLYFADAWSLGHSRLPDTADAHRLSRRKASHLLAPFRAAPGAQAVLASVRPGPDVFRRGGARTCPARAVTARLVHGFRSCR